MWIMSLYPSLETFMALKEQEKKWDMNEWRLNSEKKGKNRMWEKNCWDAISMNMSTIEKFILILKKELLWDDDDMKLFQFE